MIENENLMEQKCNLIQNGRTIIVVGNIKKHWNNIYLKNNSNWSITHVLLSVTKYVKYDEYLGKCTQLVVDNLVTICKDEILIH